MARRSAWMTAFFWNLIAGCGGDVILDVSIEEVPGTAGVTYELLILDAAEGETCAIDVDVQSAARRSKQPSSSVQHSQYVRPGTMSSDIGLLDDDDHLFVVVGRNEDCVPERYGCQEVPSDNSSDVVISTSEVDFTGLGQGCPGFACGGLAECAACTMDSDCDANGLFRCQAGVCTFGGTPWTPVVPITGELGDYIALAVGPTYMDIGVVYPEGEANVVRSLVETHDNVAGYESLEDILLSSHFLMNGSGIALRVIDEVTHVVVAGRSEEDATLLGRAGTIAATAEGLQDGDVALALPAGTATPIGRPAISVGADGRARYVVPYQDGDDAFLLTYQVTDGAPVVASREVTSQAGLDYLVGTNGRYLAYPDPDNGQNMFLIDSDTPSAAPTSTPDPLPLRFGEPPQMGWSLLSESYYAYAFSSAYGTNAAVGILALDCNPEADPDCYVFTLERYIVRARVDPLTAPLTNVTLAPLTESNMVAWALGPHVEFAILDGDDQLLGEVQSVYTAIGTVSDIRLAVHRPVFDGPVCNIVIAILEDNDNVVTLGGENDAVTIAGFDMVHPDCGD